MDKAMRKLFVRIGAAVVLAGAVFAVATSAASATGGVTITSPSLGNVDVYFDANGNGVHEANEFVGTFPAYPGTGIGFHWAPYSFPTGANGSYYITLWQNTTPLDKPTWVMRKAGHDFADNPAGTDYLMGPFFDYENICDYCPSIINIQLESYQYKDGDVLYFPFSASLTDGSKPRGFAQSSQFVIQDIPGAEHKKGGGGCPAGTFLNTDTGQCEKVVIPPA